MGEPRTSGRVWLERYFQNEASSDEEDDENYEDLETSGHPTRSKRLEKVVSSNAATTSSGHHHHLHGSYARRWRLRRACRSLRNRSTGLKAWKVFGSSSSSEGSTNRDLMVTGDSFCNCPLSKFNVRYSSCSDSSSASDPCKCGEEDTDFDWTWDNSLKLSTTTLNSDDREVKFHPEFSCGTAAVRGSQRMIGGQYYWEVKMTTPVYGTDMMIGVGTTEMDLLKYRYIFGSLLGSDCESWALSYTGNIHHRGVCQNYTSKFGQGNIIGLHLDMWHGTLSFFKNRCPLGIAYHGLRGKELYPMVSSTSARSGMKVVRSRSFNSSLQFLCCVKLRQMVPSDESVLDAVEMPPGLRSFLKNNLGWLLCSKDPEQRKSKLECDSKRFWAVDGDSSEDGGPGGGSSGGGDLGFSREWKRFCLPLVPYSH